MKEIQHFSHRHRLKLNESKKRDARCAACPLMLLGDIYGCYDCQYYLHEECAKLEDEIEHSHQPFHSLKLHASADDGDFNCDVCQKRWSGFTYRCTDCNFKVDVRCAPKSKIRLPFHHHDLKLQVSDTENEQSFFCDFCRTRCYSHRGRGLHCKDCNFKIDLDCAGMLMKFEPIKHVSHEHWLIYDDSIKARDRKYCAACRKMCDGAAFDNTYCCKPCYFFLHKSCAMYPTKIKLFSLHSDHPLMLSNRKERERCDFCNLTCQALTFRCDLCNFKIDYLCARMLKKLPTLQEIDHFSHPHFLHCNRRGTTYAKCEKL